MGFGISIFVLLIGLMFVVLLVLAAIFVLAPLLSLIGRSIAHVFRFIGGMLGDTIGIVGAVLAALFLVPMILGNVVIGRWSRASHFGRALQREMSACGTGVYRVAVGHPARFLFLGRALEGIEQRLPGDVAGAPGRDRPTKAVGQFPGYTVIGSLPGGGSGAKLYVATPSDQKRSQLETQSGKPAHTWPGSGLVVIKAFSVADGSTLPQIVRESRALEAARKLGLVLEHELTETRFHYVMPYVEGEPLTEVTKTLHARSGAEGLGTTELRQGVAAVAELVRTLSVYHQGGLWHKDVKPDNVIVARDGRAHLVDFGLITPLRSAMTLTTHGTEYFRDPEMVRMALSGVKVRDVDAARFDLYGAGAVLYAVLEGSFPAHGGLSTISKRCPEALRWIVRRAMTDLDRRYANADEMLADLETVLASDNPASLKPAMLPSMGGERPADVRTASFEQTGKPAHESFGFTPVSTARTPAHEQLTSAQEKVKRARTRACGKWRGGKSRRSCGPRAWKRNADKRHGVNAGVVTASVVLMLVLGTGLMAVMLRAANNSNAANQRAAALEAAGQTTVDRHRAAFHADQQRRVRDAVSTLTDMVEAYDVNARGQNLVAYEDSSTVLLVDRLSAPNEDEQRVMQELLRELEAQGFRVIAGDDEHAAHAEASLLKQLGASSPISTENYWPINRWLEGTAGGAGLPRIDYALITARNGATGTPSTLVTPRVQVMGARPMLRAWW